jgi:hypothetical protein
MRIILIVLFSCIFFFSSCQLYDHTNPFDPENPLNKNSGTNAGVKITEYSINDDFPGIFNGDKGLTVTIMNDGKGSTEGEIVGVLSSNDNSVSYLIPDYNKGSYVHKESGSKYPLAIYPGDLLEAGYRIHVPTSRPLPYNITFLIEFSDGYNNLFSDSLIVTID